MKRPPDISISRLSLYLRFLEDYSREINSKPTIDSKELARFLNMNPHQIRKDLSYFGKFGERGVGYRIEELKEKISRILGLVKNWNLCLCGLGNLGLALSAYQGFKDKHLDIVAIFDKDVQKIGKTVNGIKVYSPQGIGPVVKKFNIEIAIIAVPAYTAIDIANKLTDAGVRAILNFAPIKLKVASGIIVRNVDLSTELMHLTHYLYLI